ncbi:mannosyltransferase (pig-m) protein [Cardiosporidium cionae]|uniref:Mannosyltransferase (Pig-m) protein n=1 Tax=Cardiosporidium cionae TaxID=476202 RepID=A0ABQ7J9P6_9APIC|nr:mannosyltransferase (pig-m) protein [Cardiosporidium cionae]|eukprot:KAF8820681.1 mannosyltransferase (pig-m) protein [Cardiosporidium cionae]
MPFKLQYASIVCFSAYIATTNLLIAPNFCKYLFSLVDILTGFTLEILHFFHMESSLFIFAPLENITVEKYSFDSYFMADFSLAFQSDCTRSLYSWQLRLCALSNSSSFYILSYERKVISLCHKFWISGAFETLSYYLYPSCFILSQSKLYGL